MLKKNSKKKVSATKNELLSFCKKLKKYDTYVAITIFVVLVARKHKIYNNNILDVAKIKYKIQQRATIVRLEVAATHYHQV